MNKVSYEHSCINLYGDSFHSFFSKYLLVELLLQRVDECFISKKKMSNIIKENVKYFKVIVSFYILSEMCENPKLYILPSFGIHFLSCFHSFSS